MNESYRDTFQARGRARAYDELEYSPGSYPVLVWTIQQEFLTTIVRELRLRVAHLRYLDFACGTGRVLSVLQPFVDEPYGIDVSTEMLASAQKRVPGAAFVTGDITKDGVLPGVTFDLITAFRFFLNAEPPLREDVMVRLARHLASPHGLFVFNNHGNLFSYKLLLAPFHLARKGKLYTAREANYLTHTQVKRLVQRAGLEICELRGFGFLSARSLRLISFQRLERLERTLARQRWLQRFGSDKVYVVRLKDQD